MDAKKLMEQYNEGKRDFRGVDLFRASLAALDLDGANMEDAVLKQANLTGSCLRNVHLGQANLSNAKRNLAPADDLNILKLGEDRLTGFRSEIGCG